MENRDFYLMDGEPTQDELLSFSNAPDESAWIEAFIKEKIANGWNDHFNGTIRDAQQIALAEDSGSLLNIFKSSLDN